MDPQVWTKQAWEERLLEFDATQSLATGDTLASVSGVTVWEGAVDKSLTMVSGAPSVSGNKAYARIVGGEHGHDYFVRVRLLTVNGDKIEDDLRLLVRDVGG